MMKLGKNEKSWLKCLARKEVGFKQGVFYFGMGRIWGSESQTRRLCESLTRKGLLVVTEGKNDTLADCDSRRWEVTKLGYQVASEI